MDSHGTGEGTFNGRLIHYEATGPFNFEGIVSLRRDLGNVPITHDGKPWAVVVVLDGDSLYTPEAEKEHIRLVSDLAEQGLKAVSYALAGHSARILFDVQAERIYSESDVALFLCEDEESATRAVLEILEG